MNRWPSPLLGLLYALRGEGVPAGPHEWMALLRLLALGQVATLDELYLAGRAVLCRSEADFDAWDRAFATTFKDVDPTGTLREQLAAWLRDAIEAAGERVEPGFSDAELWKELLDRLATQTERHDGGNHWIGTGGTSPFGHSGRATRGIRVGGKGGGRGAIAVAHDRAWEGYRTDRTLDHRDLTVALRQLRKLQREGRWELDVPGTIDRTAKDAGELSIVEQRERQNQVRLVLFADAGGSMDPHARLVSALFTAAEEAGHFRSLDTFFFHNCVYDQIWVDEDMRERRPTAEVVAELTPAHRVVLVGDASMAPWELFHASGWGGQVHLPGLEQLRRLRRRCPASVWLNPDPRRFWDHPTVTAIGGVFPMFELTVDGLREAVAVLRRPV